MTVFDNIITAIQEGDSLTALFSINSITEMRAGIGQGAQDEKVLHELAFAMGHMGAPDMRPAFTDGEAQTILQAYMASPAGRNMPVYHS